MGTRVKAGTRATAGIVEVEYRGTLVIPGKMELGGQADIPDTPV